MSQTLSTTYERSGRSHFMGALRCPVILASLTIFTLFLSILSLGIGAMSIPPSQVFYVLYEGLLGQSDLQGNSLVILQIRLPRILMALLCGAALSVSGALMQGLFRNPLADPGIIGVSAGASLAAAFIIVIGDTLLASFIGPLPFFALPVAAFIGALLAVLLLSAVSIKHGQLSVVTMLLAGIAFSALAGACLGLLSYISDDRQLRDITFWTMGSISGASWIKVAAVAPFILPILIMVPLLARGLNALSLGEAEAFHLGIPVQRIKVFTILCVAIAVGAAVAACGLIGFVGIVVPHILRIAFGADHRLLLPASAIAGAALLVCADSIARTIVAPAELPIGILTALIGAPFFMWLLLGKQRSMLQ
ncbi:iron ABC transporter permease [Microvirga sp. W0021]|uniref:Iron ABC transporter permease n=1 Tax=Hohaiivirga grylli TaxID=3133970 RepID=A0ABV0BMN2_9HYPH